MEDKNICKLCMTVENALEIEEDGEMFSVARNVTIEQALNIARVFTSKYDEVRLFDDEYEAFISFVNKIDKPTVHTYYVEDEEDVAKKFGLYEESEDFDQTDLDKEKWDNYYGDYNQCGLRISY